MFIIRKKKSFSVFCKKKVFIGVAMITCCLIIKVQDVRANASTDSLRNNDSIFLKDSIIRVKNLGRSPDTVMIQDIIEIEISTSKNIDSLTTLYVDDIPIPGVIPWKTDNIKKLVYFRLDQNVDDLVQQFVISNPLNRYYMPIHFGVGSRKQNIANASRPLVIVFRASLNTRAFWIIVFELILLIALGVKYNILKDSYNIYYSLAGTQVVYWFLLIFITWLLICFKAESLPEIPSSTLAILGITLSTTIIARYMDKEINQKTITNNDAKSKGFVLDILSDYYGLKFQRLQSVAVNLFMGTIFLFNSLEHNFMYQFDKDILIVFVISSITYLSLKNTETVKNHLVHGDYN